MTEASSPAPQRTIRSFVVRAGRMTDAQERAFAALWAEYGLVCQGRRFQLETLFPTPQPTVLEIGFGMGDSLLMQAAADPDRNFIGIEVHKPGVGRLMNEASKLGIQNLRVVCEDAVDVLADGFGPSSLAGVQIYFPDPWHKKRHHKRRLIQSEFIDLLAHRVALGGFCHLATDWAPYAEWILGVFARSAAWHNESPEADYVPRPERRPITKFERRGQGLGHAVFDLLYTRKASEQHL